jgi:membrane-bound lytic murein transglycosylase D
MTRTYILIGAAACVLALDAGAMEPSGGAAPGEAADLAEGAFQGAPLGAAEVPESEAIAVAGRTGLPLPAAVAVLGEDEDDPEVSQEVAAESAELDELREAEEHAALVPPPAAAAGEPAEDDGERIPLLPQIPHGLARLQAKYDIPIDVNESVVAYVRFFQTEPARKHFLRWLGRLARYDRRYREILKEEGLPQDTIFLAMIESGFANLATSRARAVGPWQFIAGTGKRMGLRQDFWVDERRDPEKAARAAAAYLRELYADFGDWRLAWAGYNAGGGKIAKAQRKGQLDFWSMARGRILKKETKGYVPKLMAAAIISKHPEAFGFRAEEIEAEAWRSYERVEVNDAVELSAVAVAAGVQVADLHELNPELRRSCTPPRAYDLKLPAGAADAFRKAWPSLSPSARLGFAQHKVVRGDSLAAIAAAYGVPAAAILRMNGMGAPRRLRPGTELVIPMSAAARKSGAAPASEAVARARIQELQQRDPRLVEPEPAAPRAAVARVEQVDGRTRATVLVQSGDSLWAISQKFGVKLEELCRWNGIQNPRRHRLQVGRELVVFTAGLPPGATGTAAFVPGAGPG